MKEKDRDNFAAGGIYCITGEEFSRGRTNLQVAGEMIRAGVRIIQYREKEMKSLYKYRQCLEIRKMTAEAGVTFIVNDDIEIARLVKADGVHIGQEDLPFQKVRELAGADMIIGLSTHSPPQAEEALALSADYIGVGPIFRTFTKKDVGEPVGLEYLDYVVRHCPLPFVAIGGIKEENIADVAGRGAPLICAVTEILEADSIAGKIAALRRKMEIALPEKKLPS